MGEEVQRWHPEVEEVRKEVSRGQKHMCRHRKKAQMWVEGWGEKVTRMGAGNWQDRGRRWKCAPLQSYIAAASRHKYHRSPSVLQKEAYIRGQDDSREAGSPCQSAFCPAAQP